MPENSSNNSSAGIGMTITGIVLFGILGCFQYNTIEGALGMIGIYLLIGMIQILSLIPIIGWIGATLINWFIIIPKFLVWAGLEYSWVVSVIFAWTTIIGFIITVIIGIVVVVYLLDRR